MLASHVLNLKDTKTHTLCRLTTNQIPMHPMRHICGDLSGSERKLSVAAEPTPPVLLHTSPDWRPLSAGMDAVLGHFWRCWTVLVPAHLRQDGNVQGHLKSTAHPELHRRWAHNKVGGLENVTHGPHEHHLIAATHKGEREQYALSLVTTAKHGVYWHNGMLC